MDILETSMETLVTHVDTLETPVDTSISFSIGLSRPLAIVKLFEGFLVG